ncbi:hypothetical protein D9615_003625 [Tricholomella constricta]|uniref:Uncharacterized protein n=1 Tax=Tricholomella constricta TaxID=117010 RepID=A0A8H5M7H0_9AGAR|nr:hypothetical protein D9615_003625 [Tricholomella constricta]
MASRTSLSTQPNRAFPSSIPSARRTSTSAIPVASLVSASPSPQKFSPNSSTPTGIPAFRSLRSLLPFGPHKHATPVSSTVSPSPQTSRSPFAHFGSVRRSMNRERKASLDVELPPVISIGHPSRDETEDPTVRRSVSCSRLEKPLPPDGPQVLNDGTSNSFRDNDDTIVFSTRHAPVLRTPSPGPPISADLSTILEADTSGLSKHIPSSSDPSRSPSPDASTPSDYPKSSHGADTDTSIFDLSTTHVANQVLDAMMLEDSKAATQWLNAGKAVIIDEDHVGPGLDTSFNIDALDPDLASVLSPHRVPSQSTNIKNLTINLKPPPQARPIIDLSKLSPASPQFSLSPASSTPIITTALLPGTASPSSLGSLRSRLPRQQSSLPRLRPPMPPSPHSPHSPSPSIIVPSSSASDSTGQGDDDTARMGPPRQRHAPPSPLAGSAFATTATPTSPATAAFSKIAPKPNSSPSHSVLTAASTPNSFTSRRLPSQSHSRSINTLAPATPSSSTQEQSPSPSTSTTSMLKAPFTQIQTPSTTTQRPSLLRTHSSSGIDSGTPPSSLSPSLSPSRLGPRPSLESTRGSASFDRPRPSLTPAPPGFEYETPARPSQDTVHGAGKDGNGGGSGSGGSASFVLARARKRSMSVQERFGRRLLTAPGRRGFDGETERERGEEDGNSNGGSSEFGELRPSSSLSGRVGRRWDGAEGGGGSVGGRAPITEWLGPRTMKAFKAAGLMDFERDQQQYERSPGSVSGLSSGPGSGTMGRFASMRSTSEYNPRAPSRMAFSEAGGSSISRRGSGSGAGMGMPYGLMESPTFTTSSGSRDRDTPRSASTAPTSVSGSSFAFLGRDRERDRDREREELRELKDKHATETGALLGALSDSQRTARVLREENGELRDRLEHVEAENGALRRVVGDLTKEAGELRVQMQMLKTSTTTSSRLGAGTWSIPARRSGLSTAIHIDQDDSDGWGSPVKDDGERSQDEMGTATRRLSSRNGRDTEEESQRFHNDHLELPQTGPVLSSTPAMHKHRRRFSTTSSIFPVPPPNMTMLLHDNDHSDSVSLNGDLEFSPAAMPIRGGKGSVNGHTHNTSVASVMSISPTTANFSMTTGSPGSLFLRPEHEMHLGDMDSLDLGTRRDANFTMDDGDWSD